MRKSSFRFLLSWLLGLGLVAAAPPQKPAAPKQANSAKASDASKKTSSAAKKPPAKKAASSKTAPKRASSKKRVSSRRSAASWRRGQQQPTPERYKEIQQALADRGYLQGPPDGKWGEDSVEALKRFQQEKNLEPTGKLDALSLIALGLGPKRDNTSQNGLVAPAGSKEQP